MGPKPSRIVASSERPSSGGLAFVTTFFSSSSFVSSSVWTKAGTSVSNRLTSTGFLSPSGVNRASRLSVPWIVWFS